MIAANWKMHGDRDDLARWLRELPPAVMERVELLLLPPFVLLPSAQQSRPAGLLLGAQTLGPATAGAYTGEVSAAMLVECACSHVLVAHSERRQQAGESDSSAALRLSMARQCGLCPILCIGEDAEQRAAGRTAEVVEQQFVGALAELSPTIRGDQLILAYEPIWAIGSGKVPSPQQLVEVHAHLRRVAEKHMQVPQRLRILYGGSVAADNAAAFAATEGVDGVLVGRASVELGQLLPICEAFAGSGD